MRRVTGAVAGLVVFTGIGCVHPSVVERAYGGDVLVGRYVSPEAYAAFLRGAIAEAEHHPEDARKAYVEAGERDPTSPEPWTRIADIECSGGRPDADGAVAHALELDPTYARAWAVKATCAGVAGDAAGAREAAARAVALDPEGDGANILVARADDGGPAAATARERLVALTVTAADPVVAWGALASWAEAHEDVALWTRALVELVRVAPERREVIARTAEGLAGAGNVGEARVVAAAALEAVESPLPVRLALAARLGLDEAIGRRDAVALRRRATRGRVTLDEAAGRALLAGERALARNAAAEASAADPGALGARLVLAVAEGGELLGGASPVRAGDARPSAAAVVAFGSAMIRGDSAAPARDALASASAGPIVAGDDRVLRPAVELVSRGVLPVEMLPPGGVVELLVVTGASGRSVSPDDPALDARHRYLALALTEPGSPATRQLGLRLRAGTTSDPVVAAALAMTQLAGDSPISPDAPRALLARNPADPLLAATALRIAEKVGDADVARRARATLSAFGPATRRVE